MYFVIDIGGATKSCEAILQRSGVNADIVPIENLKLSGEIDGIIVPGVGNYGASMKRIYNSGNLNHLRDLISVQKIKTLGICVGAQIFGFGSEETKGAEGLKIFDFRCIKFHSDLDKLPHIGWEDIDTIGCPNFSRLEAKRYYFSHSFYMKFSGKACINLNISMARNVNCIFPAIISSDNITLCQFHPEKSGANGMNFFKHWLSL